HYAVDGAQRMQQMITDLLEYSRVQRRGHPFAPVEMNSACEDALANLQLLTRECGAEISHDPLPRVMGDYMQLLRLIQNLLGNALKYRAKEAVPRIHIGARRDDGQWVLWIKDNGIGIEAQFFERIFGVFQRLHTREEYPGTGIGLALCRRIVERHGGRIWVESEPGEGSTFLFTLPMIEEAGIEA
ncbi:MAG: PAS domain-containing sensor histidine kinase, partial [Rhodospirillales bacterium]|nr:PAS domain-containing sensor histidine kinase [Rhodospirillales bacterium]